MGGGPQGRTAGWSIGAVGSFRPNPICILGLSIVTNLCFPDALKPANIEKIPAAAAEAEPKLRTVVLGVPVREGA